MDYIKYKNILKETVGNNTKVIEAEILHAVKEEMVMKLVDVVFRRTNWECQIRLIYQPLNVGAENIGNGLEWHNSRREKKSMT